MIGPTLLVYETNLYLTPYVVILSSPHTTYLSVYLWLRSHWATDHS